MRVRLALSAVASFLLLGLAAAPALAFDDLTVDAVGTVSTDGTLVLSGTYRCLSDGTPGPVFVSSTLVQGDESTGVGGTLAICDGQVREWTNTAHSEAPRFERGGATVRATLLKLATQSGIPLPQPLAHEEARIELR